MFSKIRAAAHQRKSQRNGMLPIYINASVLHKLQFNRRATKLLYNKRAELSLVKRWAIGDTGKLKKRLIYGKKL